MPSSSEHTALRHHAFLYEADEEYVARSVAFLTEGLEAGEGCIAAHNREGLALMRDALGPDADRVALVDVGSTYTRPARAVAAYYGAFLGELQRAPAIRAVADFQMGPAPQEWDEWVGYEAITNLAYAHLPVWVVCTYNANALPERILEGMESTHARVLAEGDRWVDSDHFEDPRGLLRRLTPAPEPLDGLRSCAVGQDLEGFRERLACELAVEAVPEAKVLDMLVAGTEIAANALRHGGGIEAVRVGRAHGRFVCEVVDRGRGFDDPAAGYLAPREGTGSGLWVARQLAWSVESFHASRGFTVRIRL